MSAFTVVYLKHKNRTMNINIEGIEQELSFELNEHKRLLDTKAKLINKKLVNTDFKKSLGMEIPSKKKIIYLDLVE
jgi:cell division protein FtsL